MKRRALFTAMTASCLLATGAVDAQRYSSPSYTPPPPRYTPPPPPPAPRYTPPPASNQNTRQSSQSGSTYQNAQRSSGTSASSSLGGYRPGSIANSNSQSSGKPSSGGATASSGARITGPSAKSGTGSTTKSASTAKQAGAGAFGKKPAPANDKGKAAAKAGPQVAATSAGAAAFGAKPAATKSSVDDPFNPHVKDKAKNDFNAAAGSKKIAANDNKKKGSGDCPPGQVWDPSLPGCVPKPPAPRP